MFLITILLMRNFANAPYFEFLKKELGGIVLQRYG